MASKTYAEKQIESALKRIKKSDPQFRRKVFIELKPFWWLPAIFRDKVLIQKRLEETRQLLENYVEHARTQSVALKDLYQWALDNDPKDGSLDLHKERLGPIDIKQGAVIRG